MDRRPQDGKDPVGFRGRVDEDAVAAFALATNDPNDLFLWGAAVPPLFTGAMILPAQGRSARAAERATIRGGTGSVHGEHDMYFHRPITPGMEVQWHVSAYAMKQTPGGVLATQRTLVEDLAGESLVEHLWSNLHLGATIDPDADAGGRKKADHTFPEAARANPVGQARIPVDRDQTFRYAGVSSDHIAHAMDDEAARQEGYSGKILQGLCTFAMCSGAVVNIGAGGDPRLLRRLAGRFSAPAYPRRDLVVDLYDAVRAEDGGRVVVFEARQDDAIVIKHGRAEFGPD